MDTMETGVKVFALRKKGIMSIIANDFAPCIHVGEIHEIAKSKHLAFFPYDSKGEMTRRNYHVINYTFYKTKEEAYEAAKQLLLESVEAQRQKVEQYFAKHPMP